MYSTVVSSPVSTCSIFIILFWTGSPHITVISSAVKAVHKSLSKCLSYPVIFTCTVSSLSEFTLALFILLYSVPSVFIVHFGFMKSIFPRFNTFLAFFNSDSSFNLFSGNSISNVPLFSPNPASVNSYSTPLLFCVNFLNVFVARVTGTPSIFIVISSADSSTSSTNPSKYLSVPLNFTVTVPFI